MNLLFFVGALIGANWQGFSDIILRRQNTCAERLSIYVYKVLLDVSTVLSESNAY